MSIKRRILALEEKRGITNQKFQLPIFVPISMGELYKQFNDWKIHPSSTGLLLLIDKKRLSSLGTLDYDPNEKLETLKAKLNAYTN